jgi:hypothetical protein
MRDILTEATIDTETRTTACGLDSQVQFKPFHHGLLAYSLGNDAATLMPSVELTRADPGYIRAQQPSPTVVLSTVTW